MFLHFDCLNSVKTRALPGWLKMLRWVFCFFSWLVNISELVKFFNFMGVI